MNWLEIYLWCRCRCMFSSVYLEQIIKHKHKQNITLNKLLLHISFLTFRAPRVTIWTFYEYTMYYISVFPCLCLSVLLFYGIILTHSSSFPLLLTCKYVQITFLHLVWQYTIWCMCKLACSSSSLKIQNQDSMMNQHHYIRWKYCRWHLCHFINT